MANVIAASAVATPGTRNVHRLENRFEKPRPSAMRPPHSGASGTRKLVGNPSGTTRIASPTFRIRVGPTKMPMTPSSASATSAAAICWLTESARTGTRCGRW